MAQCSGFGTGEVLLHALCSLSQVLARARLHGAKFHWRGGWREFILSGAAFGCKAIASLAPQVKRGLKPLQSRAVAPLGIYAHVLLSKLLRQHLTDLDHKGVRPLSAEQVEQRVRATERRKGEREKEKEREKRQQ